MVSASAILRFYLISGVGTAAAFAGALLLRPGRPTWPGPLTAPPPDRAYGGSTPWPSPAMQVANAPLSRVSKIYGGGAIEGAYAGFSIPGGPHGRSPKSKAFVAPLESMVDKSLGAKDAVIELNVLPIWLQPLLALTDSKITYTLGDSRLLLNSVSVRHQKRTEW